MNITVVGSGYVGLVTGACLSAHGHVVTCADVDARKTALLQQSIVPFLEPDLDGLVAAGNESGALSFTTDVASAIKDADLIFIAVGTPPRPDGSADTSAVFNVAGTILSEVQRPTTLVVRSTAPVGTSAAIREKAIAAGAPVTVLSNPEFLREGHSVHDFNNPARVVIGVDDSEHAAMPLVQLYEGFVPSKQIVVLDTRSAEFSKYVSNAYLATKISFINEMALLAENVHADIEYVRRVVGLDPRIGPDYLMPGLGYGGSCLPKDVTALISVAGAANVDVPLLSAVNAVNLMQPKRLLEKARAHFGGTLADRRIALLGIAFKPNTDDIRGAPFLSVAQELIDEGAVVTCYDPVAMTAARSVLGEQATFAHDPYSCVAGADAVILVTEWSEFRSLDWGRVKELMNHPLVLDGRNAYDPEVLQEEGFTYHCVGRGSQVRTRAGMSLA